MLREKIVTIVIGLFVGALLAGLFFFGPKLISKNSKQVNPTSKTPTAKPSEAKIAKKVSLLITTPENNSSTVENEIKLTGVSSPNTKIIVYSNADQKEVISDSNGKFGSNVKLEEGENEIIVASLTKPMETKSINVTMEMSK